MWKAYVCDSLATLGFLWCLLIEGKDSGQWDAASEPWADFVRNRKDFFRDEMNNPAALRMVGDVKGKQLLDLSCGEGYNTRILARRGARVVGVDFSKEMVMLARERERRDRLGIRYYLSDAADLEELGDRRFDVVTCFMALMDIERYEDAVSEVARVLKKDGRFVFSITHPCFEYGIITEGEPNAEWKGEGGAGAAEEEGVCLEVRRYFGETKGEVVWDMKRLSRPFRTSSFHRTLTDYFRVLRRNGFVVTGLVEPKPTPSGASRFPSLRKHTLIPHSMIIEAGLTR